MCQNSPWWQSCDRCNTMFFRLLAWSKIRIQNCKVSCALEPTNKNKLSRLKLLFLKASCTCSYPKKYYYPRKCRLFLKQNGSASVSSCYSVCAWQITPGGGGGGGAGGQSLTTRLPLLFPETAEQSKDNGQELSIGSGQKVETHVNIFGQVGGLNMISLIGVHGWMEQAKALDTSVSFPVKVINPIRCHVQLIVQPTCLL